MIKKVTRAITAAAFLCMAILAFVVLRSHNRNAINRLDHDQIERALLFSSAKDTSINVHPFRTPDGYILAIPAYWDLSSIQVACSDEMMSLSSAGKEITSERQTIVCNGDSIVTLHRRGLFGGKLKVRIVQSALPTISIKTNSGSLSAIHEDKSHKEKGWIEARDIDGGKCLNDSLDYIKGRGNGTWEIPPKKPYKIKLKKKHSILGLCKDDKFNLLANYLDHSQLRNYIVNHVAKGVGLKPTYKSDFVSLYIDGHYLGIYELTNRIKTGKHFVDVDNLAKRTENVNEKGLKKYPVFTESNEKGIVLKKGIDNAVSPDDITGGYLLEKTNWGKEKEKSEKSFFYSNRRTLMIVKSPKYATRDEMNYIADWFQKAEDAVYSDTTNDTAWRSFLDVETFTRYYLCQEVFQNYDAGGGSFFMYKDVDSVATVLKAGPIWDFDACMGNENCYEPLYRIPNTLYARSQKINSADYTLLAMLGRNQCFMDSVKYVWKNQFKGTLCETLFGKSLAQKVGDMQTDLWLNSLLWYGIDRAYDYQNDIVSMQQYMRERIAFIDEIWFSGHNYNIVEVNFNVYNSTHLVSYYVPHGSEFEMPEYSVFDKSLTEWRLNGGG